MRRYAASLLAGSLCLSAPSLAHAATTVPPGTSRSLNAEGCVTNSGALGDDSGLDCPLSVCASDCEIGTNRAKVAFNLDYITLGKRFVESTVYSEFVVDAGTSGQGHEVDATVSYDVGWQGQWFLLGILTGANDVQATVTLYLWDRDAGSKVIRQTQLHQEDVQSAGSLPEIPGDVGGHLDHGSTSNSFTVKVVRGHKYRVGLRVHAEGTGFANASINVDYLGGANGASWTDLTVALGSDFEERLAHLESRVDSLTSRVDSLEERMNRVEDEVHHHTHQYLTGRGEGHNNVVATTSEAILQDDGEPTPDELRPLPHLEGHARPLPIQSVIATSADPGAAGTASIRFVLPEPLPVTIRVYDTMGRLVSDVLNSSQTAGTHEVRFDARSLPAGIYYYRLQAGPYAENRKLTLLK